jgi:hypothetical protein
MKRTLISLMVAGLFAMAGTSAIAQNVTADDQKAAADPNKPSAAATTEMKPTDAPKGDASTAKADYTAAKAKAQTEYKDAKAKCDSMKGDAMRTCVSEAKTTRKDALAMAETNWKSHK